MTLHFDRGDAYGKAKRPGKAIDDYTEALARDIDDEQKQRAYTSRARQRNVLGHFNDALDDATKAIRISPDAWSYAERCAAYNGLNQPKMALADCDEAIRIRENTTEAYRYRAMTKRLLKDESGARADLAKAKELEAQGSP